MLARSDLPRPKMGEAQAAAYLNLAPSTLKAWRLTRRGPRFAKLGDRVVYDPDDLDRWVEAHKRTSTRG